MHWGTWGERYTVSSVTHFHLSFADPQMKPLNSKANICLTSTTTTNTTQNITKPLYESSYEVEQSTLLKREPFTIWFDLISLEWPPFLIYLMDSQARTKEKRSVAVAMRPTHCYRVGQATTHCWHLFGRVHCKTGGISRARILTTVCWTSPQLAGFNNTKY